VPAALFMALTRTLVRAAVAENLTPAEVLSRVNDLLIPDTRQGMFVTAVYAVLDQETGEFTYVNAGHNPPLWICSGEQIEKLTRTGIALGVTYSNPLTQVTLRLKSGESIFLYTDGLTEAFSPKGNLYGESRLMEAIRTNKSPTAEGLLETVETSLKDFISSEPLSDDLTLLVVRRK
jgi:sigma-B regulation protein RsbU (phosphoserine phosphatase)